MNSYSIPAFAKFVFILLCTVFICSSCGFRAVYSTQDNPDLLLIANDLAGIRIKKDRERTSQVLKNKLYDLLNPDYLKVEPKYFLSLTVKKSNSSTFTTNTGASGRNKITLEVSYELKDLGNAMIIAKGSTLVSDSFDVTDNRYATEIANDSVQNNLSALAAQNIRNMLVNDFIGMNKNKDVKK